jgi:hypothetical protein
MALAAADRVGAIGVIKPMAQPGRGTWSVVEYTICRRRPLEAWAT